MFKARLLSLIDMDEPSVDDPLAKEVNVTEMTGEGFDPKAAGDTTEITGSKG